jgi:uncharacterized membrane protein (UPF0182 family)
MPYAPSYGRLGNYIRNPVKATVDAYHGTVTLWNVSPEEPIVQAYREIFPGAFADADSMPDDLRRHMRAAAAGPERKARRVVQERAIENGL